MRAWLVIALLAGCAEPVVPDEPADASAPPRDAGIVALDARTPEPDAAVEPEPSVRVVFPPSGATSAERITIRGTARNVEHVRVAGVDAQSDDGFATWHAEVPLALGAQTITVEAGHAHAEIELERAASDDDVARGDGPRNLRIFGLAMSDDARTAYVCDDIDDGVITIDVATGARVLATGGESGATIGYELVQPTAIALDPPRQRALLADDGALIGADLASREQRIVSPAHGDLAAIVHDGDRVIALDAEHDAIVAIDLATGARTTLTDETSGTGPSMRVAFRMDVDRTARRAYATLQYRNDVLEIDLATGARRVLSGSGAPMTEPVALAVAPDRGELFVWTSERTIVAVDLASGTRRALGGSGFTLERIQALVMREGVLWAYERGANALLAIDPETGDRVVLSRGDAQPY
ncbi:YncE family protein [Sandaracinus amylolyticus]|uniref:Uncharacterized protein n=1 Tax=Sandaracinus amylolyticus TaxID=927083 RepID=A0A0F6W0F1_9BACT|nr:PQQ-binding-like beta-propeller repeat protein [Sandaracinus amylolyticus]AKF04102.1 hypothetical protein DB32_001251 [Sandaracinus amylolyticus]